MKTIFDIEQNVEDYLNRVIYKAQEYKEARDYLLNKFSTILDPEDKSKFKQLKKLSLVDLIKEYSNV